MVRYDIGKIYTSSFISVSHITVHVNIIFLSGFTFLQSGELVT